MGGLAAGGVRGLCGSGGPARQPARVLGCPGQDCSSQTCHVWNGQMEVAGAACSLALQLGLTQENGGGEFGAQESRKN